MSYLTVEVEIDNGRIIPREPEKLPLNGSALLTILNVGESPQAGPRPFGLAKGEVNVPPDFNAPLPEAELRAFEGE